jgi:hypothetical protein
MTLQTQASKYISEDGKKVTKILWDEEYEEFQVKLWASKKFQKDATYHTNDLEDAVGTAKAMVK